MLPLIRLGKRTEVFLPVLHGNPKPRLHIGCPALDRQAFQPFYGNIQFSGRQISLCHQKCMQLFLILRKTAAFLNPFQLFLSRGDHLYLLQFLFHRRMDTSWRGIIVIHDRSLLLPLQGKRHGGRNIRMNFTDCNRSGTDIMEDFLYSLRIPHLGQTLFFCFQDQRMLFFSYDGVKHFRAAQTLHPQRKTAVFLHSHHQRPSAVMAECHMKQRSGGKQSLQDSIRSLRGYLEKQSLRQTLLTIGIQQNAVLLIHTAHVLPGLCPGSLLKQKGKGSVHPPSEEGMDHNLSVPGLIPEMLHQDCFIIRQPLCGSYLSF